ncbi:hypothetical protein C1H46_020603 [Malus baccata]|uniref:Uncharacterized protein n=1 Tax=Malus baccata TaxID=106549 RepID=A0A540M4V9_MALBA|nr:hypothetical protein C1H46_020603 [Malus baccata]
MPYPISIVCYDDSRFQVDRTPDIVFHFTGPEFPVSADNAWAMNSQGQNCLVPTADEVWPFAADLCYFHKWFPNLACTQQTWPDTVQRNLLQCLRINIIICRSGDDHRLI